MNEVISVYALNKYVKSLLETNEILSSISIKGEISGFVNHIKSGHFYFTLKDEKSSVKAVMFRSYNEKLAFVPENGMQVVVAASVSLYEKDGSFQIYVYDVFPAGIGAAAVAFEQLKARLNKEGLFSEDAKKPLPKFPKTIGLITSKTGAAIKDILAVANRQFPLIEFILQDVTVQGERAASEICAAIKKLDSQKQVDLIIVARGGGSALDLNLFNNEQIARCVFECKKPLVSAIGHEIDYTIIDFVADVRAATPTAAAEIVLPNIDEIRFRLITLSKNLSFFTDKKTQMCYNKLLTLKEYVCKDKVLSKLDTLQARIIAENVRLGSNIQQTFEKCETKVARYKEILSLYDPGFILKKGYALVRKNGKLAKTVAVGDEVSLELSSVTAVCRVLDIS